MQEKQLKQTSKLCNKLKHPLEPDMLWFFSDEKNFCQDQKINSQNRWLTVTPKDVPKLMQTKFSMTSVVHSERDVMPSYFFPEVLKLNNEGRIRVHSEVVKPWIGCVAAGRPYMWQQDSAPYYYSWKTQA